MASIRQAYVKQGKCDFSDHMRWFGVSGAGTYMEFQPGSNGVGPWTQAHHLNNPKCFEGVSLLPSSWPPARVEGRLRAALDAAFRRMQRMQLMQLMRRMNSETSFFSNPSITFAHFFWPRPPLESFVGKKNPPEAAAKGVPYF